MRAFLFSAVAAGLAISSVGAAAESWKATAKLDAVSPFLCRQADVSAIVLEFAEQGDQLLVTTGGNGSYAVPIASDGSVSGAISVPVGDRSFAVDLTGNAKSRHLSVFNRKYSCRFQLLPLS